MLAMTAATATTTTLAPTTTTTTLTTTEIATTTQATTITAIAATECRIRSLGILFFFYSLLLLYCCSFAHFVQRCLVLLLPLNCSLWLEFSSIVVVFGQQRATTKEMKYLTVIFNLLQRVQFFTRCAPKASKKLKKKKRKDRFNMANSVWSIRVECVWGGGSSNPRELSRS